MDPLHHALGYADCCVSPLLASFRAFDAEYSGLLPKHIANEILTDAPQFGYFSDGIVSFRG